MAVSTDVEATQQNQQAMTLTTEQASALEVAMAEGSLRDKKAISRASLNNILEGSTASIFKPGYQIQSSWAPAGLMSPRISPGQKPN